MTSVAHVITSLDVGGAERALTHVAAGLRRRGVRQLVVSLLPPGRTARTLEEIGVPVHGLDLRPDAPLRSGVALAGLVGLLRRARPDVVQTWMYHADLLGGTAARLAGVEAVAWNVRHADLPLEGYGRSTAAIGRLSVPASRVVPRLIVTNSLAAREAHAARGYPRERMRVIPNGVAGPARAGLTRTAARHVLGLRHEAPVVGHVGRFHDQKDYPTLLRAAREVLDRVPDVRFALVGEGLESENATLVTWIRDAGVERAVHLCGPRADASRLPVAFDVAVSSSAYGEACPNTLLEAMVLGTPVVTTDVGDSGRVVGTSGVVVPPRRASSLAQAVASLLQRGPEERARLGLLARRRVEEHDSLAAMVDGYEAVYRELRDPSKPASV